MKFRRLMILFSCLLICGTATTARASRQDIVITNRGAASISVINAATHSVTHYPLPSGTTVPEPMYPAFIPGSQRLYVGDRGNNRVIMFDARDYGMLGEIPVGAGVFHMWAEKSRGQLWVNNDVDKSISVINTSTNAVITTFPTPTDLNGLGGKPHDVILDPTAPFAYVTMIGVTGQNDYVVKYSTESFLEVDRAAVGKDPHVSLSAANNLLYVPTQNANEVRVLDRSTLDFVTSIPIANEQHLGNNGAGIAGGMEGPPNDSSDLELGTNVPGAHIQFMADDEPDKTTFNPPPDVELGIPGTFAPLEASYSIYGYLNPTTPANAPPLPANSTAPPGHQLHTDEPYRRPMRNPVGNCAAQRGRRGVSGRTL